MSPRGRKKKELEETKNIRKKKDEEGERIEIDQDKQEGSKNNG